MAKLKYYLAGLLFALLIFLSIRKTPEPTPHWSDMTPSTRSQLIAEHLEKHNLEILKPDPETGIPHVVVLFWFGNPMKGERLEAYESLKENIGVPTLLLTEDMVPRLNLSFSPIHPAWHHLSAIHRGDYLRVYLHYHFGGGYHDVKFRKPGTGWAQEFKKFQNPNLWALLVQEEMEFHVACNEIVAQHEVLVGNLCKYSNTCCSIVRSNYAKLGSPVALIIRPETELVQRWFTILHEILDHKLERLKQNPPPYPRCCPRLDTPEERAYPIRWAELLGETFHPLQLNYTDHTQVTLSRWEALPYSNEDENKK